MATKGSILSGLLEHVSLKALARLKFNGSNDLSVTVAGASSVAVTSMPTTTVTGTVNANTVNSEGACSVSGTSHALSHHAFHASFRRNLV